MPGGGMPGGGVPGMPENVRFSFSGAEPMDAARAQELFARFFGGGNGLGGMMGEVDPFASMHGGRGMPSMMDDMMGGMMGGMMGSSAARGRQRARDGSFLRSRPDRLP